MASSKDSSRLFIQKSCWRSECAQFLCPFFSGGYLSRPGFSFANCRNHRHTHFSFLEGFFHLSSPVKYLTQLGPKLRGKHLLSIAGIIWEIYSSTDPLITAEPLVQHAQYPACWTGMNVCRPSAETSPWHLHAMLEKSILTPWFKALALSTVLTGEACAAYTAHSEPSKAQSITGHFLPGLQMKKAEHCNLLGNASSRQPHPWFLFHRFHAILPQDNMIEGTRMVIFVRLAFIGGDPTL